MNLHFNKNRAKRQDSSQKYDYERLHKPETLLLLANNNTEPESLASNNTLTNHTIDTSKFNENILVDRKNLKPF